MDAKSLQLALTFLASIVVLGIVADVITVVRRRRPRLALRPQIPGLAMAGCGLVTFACIAVVFSSPQPGWEAASPKDQGYTWFPFVPTAMLGAITVQIALVPRHAARLLESMALAVAAAVLGLYLLSVATDTSSEGAIPALMAVLIFFCFPALVTGLVVDETSRPGGKQRTTTHAQSDNG